MRFPAYKNLVILLLITIFKVLNLTNQVEKELLTIENKAKGFIISNDA